MPFAGTGCKTILNPAPARRWLAERWWSISPCRPQSGLRAARLGQQIDTCEL
jgi:hypothetical protein